MTEICQLVFLLWNELFNPLTHFIYIYFFLFANFLLGENYHSKCVREESTCVSFYLILCTQF